MSLFDKLFSKEISQDAFAKLVMESLAAKGVTQTAYDKQNFSITIGNDPASNAVFLQNTYAHYQTADKARRALLLEHLTGSFASKPSIPATYAEAMPYLMPIVRAPTYFSLVSLDLDARTPNAKTSLVDCPTKPICDGLVALLAYDTQHSILQVNHDRFNLWGVSFDAALSDAANHLRDNTDARLLREVFPGVYQGQWADSYETARILLTDLIYRVPVEGEHVAFLPSRDNLFITGTLNVSGLAKLLEIADELHFAGHPLSPSFFLLNDKKWTPYLPGDPTLRARSLQIIRKREAVDYNQQGESLQKIHQRDKLDIFVGKYMVIQRKDSSEFSTTLWTNGVDSLLPKAEYLTLGIDPAKKQFLTVPWSIAFPIFSSLLEEQPNLLPIRYRARAFPTEQQLAALRPHALPLG